MSSWRETLRVQRDLSIAARRLIDWATPGSTWNTSSTPC